MDDLDDELSRLVEQWDKGTFEDVVDSVRYHYRTHGPALGSNNLMQYLRQAQAFRQNLRGARQVRMSSGDFRYTKDGRYIIVAGSGKILSFGIARRSP